MSDPVTSALLSVAGYQATTGKGVVGKALKVPRPPVAPSVPGIGDTASAADALRRKLAGQSGYGSALMLSQPGGGIRLGPQRHTLGASMLLGTGGVREYVG